MSNQLSIALEALQRIANCDDAPDINPKGDWEKGLYCGVEDRDCRDRYEGAYYGYSRGCEIALEWAVNEARLAIKTINTTGTNEH